MFQKVKILLFPIIIFTLIFISSCKKDTDFGLQMIPGGDTFNTVTVDTFTIKSYTYSSESYWIQGVNRLLAGSYTDPVFGQTNASFALQFVPVSIDSLRSTYMADSMVMYIPLDAKDYCYGDPNVQQHIEIYRLAERLYSEYDNVRYNSEKSTANMYYDEQTFATVNFIPKNVIIEKLKKGNDTVTVRRLKIKLPQYFANSILAQDDSVLNTYDNFLQFFKGIYVKSANPQSNESIMRFLINEYTKMTLYYRKGTDTLTFDFSANTNRAAKLNFASHNYNTTSFYPNINKENIIQDSVTYIQAMGGVKTKIFLPGIENMKNITNDPILRAQLIIKTEDSPLTYQQFYPTITTLYLEKINEDGSTSLLPDYIATYDPKRNEYRFDLASYISAVAAGKSKHYGFYLRTYNLASVYSRSVITTSSNSDPMKLVITYNKLK